MLQHLHKFLILRHALHLPGVGSFTIHEEPARADSESRLLFAPRPVISFGSGEGAGNGRSFFQFLATEMGTDEDAAEQEFTRFAREFREQLQQHEMAVLPGVGRLVKRDVDQLSFTPESSLLELLPPVAWHEAGDAAIATAVQRKPKQKIKTEPIVQEVPAPVAVPEPAKEIGLATAMETVLVEEETAEQETVRDRWWLYAIILLAAGILALLFYYQ